MDMALILAKANYWGYVVLLLIGLYALISKNNLVKKIIGMVIFQTAVILFYITIAVKKGGNIPITPHGKGYVVDVANYMNPLPHVLMLTAIVVGVATLGVALALAIKVYKQYGTLEEDEINAMIREQ